MALKPHECSLVDVFAAQVRARRQALGLSQEQLAEKAGVHRTYVGMLERSEKNVTIYNIGRIANALAVDPALLLRKSK
jgi:transcriptional regulator with XRE-family HTH domain